MRVAFIFALFLFSSLQSVIYGLPLHTKPLINSEVGVSNDGTTVSIPEPKGKVNDLQNNFPRSRRKSSGGRTSHATSSVGSSAAFVAAAHSNYGVPGPSTGNQMQLAVQQGLSEATFYTNLNPSEQVSPMPSPASVQHDDHPGAQAKPGDLIKTVPPVAFTPQSQTRPSKWDRVRKYIKSKFGGRS